MTVTVRMRFHLPALLVMLAAVGCAIQGPSPKGAVSDGARLTAPEAPQPTKFQQLALQMAMGTHGEAYLVWLAVEEGQDDGLEIRFSRSGDGGATWSGPLWSRKPAQGMFSDGVRLAAGPTGQVYLTWRERDAGKSDTRILVTRSLDGGRHWDGVPRELAAGDHLSPPQLQTGPDGALYVAWLGGDESHRVLEVAASQDSGGTFAPKPAQIQPVLSASHRGIMNPRLAGDDKGRLYVVWEEGKAGPRRHAGIYLSRSEDHGRTWSESILVSRPGADSRGSHNPQIVTASGGQVYLIWEEAEQRTVKVEGRRRPLWPVDRMIYFNRSLDGGRTWLNQPIRLSQPDPMSPNRRKGYATQITCDESGHVYITVIEEREATSRRLLVFHSADSGATWAAPAELEGTSPIKGRIEGAVLAYSGSGRLSLIWQEHAFGPRYGWFVLMNRSANFGQQWADQAVILGESTVGQTTGRNLFVGAGENGLVLTAWDHGVRVYQPITLNRSADGGKSWSQSRLPLD